MNTLMENKPYLTEKCLWNVSYSDMMIDTNALRYGNGRA